MVNLEVGVWIFEKHKTAKKTGRPRIIYLCPEALELTKRLGEGKPADEPLFLRFGERVAEVRDPMPAMRHRRGVTPAHDKRSPRLVLAPVSVEDLLHGARDRRRVRERRVRLTRPRPAADDLPKAIPQCKRAHRHAAT